MHSPFIYKYQPLYLKDFEMDQELVSLIKALIEMDTLNVLFVGDSGSGKTSIIQAIIREYYSECCSDDDILFINSLKDQGIAYYRTDVKTFCQTACSVTGRKKMLILDDLDIINEQSQQVFRNCIDKYSHNVHFVASTSNTQKTIDSLQSRMTLVRVKALDEDNLRRIMEKICRAEELSITAEAKAFLLKISNSSVRILINYLEKLKLLSKSIDLDTAMLVCTNISFQQFEEYIHNCKETRDLRCAVKCLYNLFDKGYSVMDILDTFFLFVKTTETISEDEKYNIIPIVCKYITIFNDVHEDEIELALFTNNIMTIFSDDNI